MPGYLKGAFAGQFKAEIDVGEFLQPRTPLPNAKVHRDVAALARWMLALMDHELARWDGQPNVGSTKVLTALHALPARRFSQFWLHELEEVLRNDLANAHILNPGYARHQDNPAISEIRAFLTAQLHRPFLVQADEDPATEATAC